MTAALAIVLDSQGNAIASIKSLSLRESIQRGSVRELGTLKKKEAPATAIDCSANFDFNLVDLIQSGIPDAYVRQSNTYEEFEDNILLEDGISIQIFKKVFDLIDPNTGLKKSKPEVFATITDLFIDEDSNDIPEGGVAQKKQSFQYLTPVLHKI